MNRTYRTWALLIAALAAATNLATAQDAPTDAAPLLAEVSVVGYDGDEVIARRSHSVALVADRPPPAQLRRGREVAVGEQYRNVGTNLSCRAKTRGSAFLLWCAFEESALLPGGGAPSFETLSVENEVLITPGGSAELGTVSEPDSNTRWTIGVTLRTRN